MRNSRIFVKLLLATVLTLSGGAGSSTVARGQTAIPASPMLLPPSAYKQGPGSPWYTGSDAQAADNQDKSVVKDVQTQLTKLGYDPGPADGVVGPKTKAALRDFQQKKGLDASGNVTPEALSALDVEGTTQGLEGAPGDPKNAKAKIPCRVTTRAKSVGNSDPFVGPANVTLTINVTADDCKAMGGTTPKAQ